MIDDKDKENKSHDFEEEFDFDANDIFEEGGDNLRDEGGALPPPPPGREGSKIPLLIGAAVLIWAGWKLYGYMFPPNPDAELEKIAAEENAAIRAAQSAAIPAGVIAAPERIQTPAVPAAPAPAQIKAPAPSVPAPAPAQIKAPAPAAQIAQPVAPILAPAPARISAPAAKAQAQAQTPTELKDLENTVNQVMDALNKMDQKMSLIGREFFAVSDNVNKLSQEMEKIKARPAAKPKPAPKVQKTQPEFYADQPSEEPEKPAKPAQVKTKKVEWVVHAVIPGRAWLRAPDGTTLTVMQGETIPHYGKVMVIDAPSSVVVTSSGAVFR